MFTANAKTIDAEDEASRASQEFSDALAVGLAREKKSIPSRFFYDARGSELFEKITKIPEYYPTRTERAILQAHAADMVAGSDINTALVEFGSGASVKTEILLRELDERATYVALDISRDALEDARDRLSKKFPNLRIIPVVADFSKPVKFPRDIDARNKLGFFPGSTIGNLAPLQAIHLLQNITRSLGPNSRLIIGVDLKKDRDILLAAYNDSAGITGEFNLNLLRRANSELGADFDIAAFEHEAIYDETHDRIDMYLVSRKPQSVKINGDTYTFLKRERIHTEHSHKYDLDTFAEMARQAGWSQANTWIDDDNLFSVHELVNQASDLTPCSPRNYR